MHTPGTTSRLVLTVLFEAGHIYVLVDGARLLFDTGAPMTFAASGSVCLLGTRQPVATSYLGLDASLLSGFVKRPVDGLLGMDILSQFDLLIDVPRSQITFSEEALDLSGDAIPIDEVMGVPVVDAQLNGRPARLFFDTGASVGYLRNAASYGGDSAGAVEDFYPGIGTFTTDTRTADLRLGQTAHRTRCGELPGLLAMALQLAGVDGIIGNDLLASRRAGLFTRRRVLVLG